MRGKGRFFAKPHSLQISRKYTPTNLLQFPTYFLLLFDFMKSIMRVTSALDFIFGDLSIKTIGEQIKHLRLDAGLSQTQLAERLGISNQAVSKWETNFSQPDITLLPDLATIFGISIDSLFGYTKEKMYTRISSRLESGDFLTLAEFAEFEQFLLSEIRDNCSHYEATSTLAGLYFSQSENLAKKAVIYGKKALELNPNNKYEISLINNASRGALYDWDTKNHHELIEYYQKLLTIAPENKRVYFFLLDNLIDDGRIQEAKKWLELSYRNNPDLLNDYYTLWIREKATSFATVKTDYLALAEKHLKDWRVLFSVANTLSQHECYQEAIPIWRAAFDAQEKPRYTDYHYAIAQCYLRLGDKENAIAAYKDMLQVLKNDWGFRFGAEVDRIQQKIQELA
ncbi:DNA-binding protein [Streptococcus merionis]|uniref:DNA-binding protein n=2 Tax=Streptococcus merionis TaxID=400065 RepID=A0A239SQY6_9STRE|nr:DNA-binding protein [Streptococcus merionis]